MLVQQLEDLRRQHCTALELLGERNERVDELEQARACGVHAADSLQSWSREAAY